VTFDDQTGIGDHLQIRRAEQPESPSSLPRQV